VKVVIGERISGAGERVKYAENNMKIAIGLPHLNNQYDARFGDALIALMAYSLNEGLDLFPMRGLICFLFQHLEII